MARIYPQRWRGFAIRAHKVERPQIKSLQKKEELIYIFLLFFVSTDCKSALTGTHRSHRKTESFYNKKRIQINECVFI